MTTAMEPVTLARGVDVGEAISSASERVLDPRQELHYLVRLTHHKGKELWAKFYLHECHDMPGGNWHLHYSGPMDDALRFRSPAAIDELARGSALGEYSYEIEAHAPVDLCTLCQLRPRTSRYRSGVFCNTCVFWLDRVDEKDRRNVVRAGHEHYQIGGEDSSARGSSRGFGGSEYFFEMRDGRRLRTTNLWTQGHVPPHFRLALPDNARPVRPSFPEGASSSERGAAFAEFRNGFTVLNVADVG